jgi:hypothetical protein
MRVAIGIYLHILVFPISRIWRDDRKARFGLLQSAKDAGRILA